MKRTYKLMMALAVMIAMFAAICVYAAAAESGAIAGFAVNTLQAQNPNDVGAVKWFSGAVDGKYYIFLPTNADRSSMTVWFSADGEVKCGDVVLENGKETSVFAEGDEFVLTCGENTYTVVFRQSANAATMYIATESGTMDAVHANKEHKEAGIIDIFDSAGKEQYNGKLSYIKGRGNSTWTGFDKKPYNIKLDKKADLFGMGKSKKWCLLASAGEHSFIRNKLMFDFSLNLGINASADVVMTDVYINSEYMGAYIVTEKVEIGETRVNIFDLEGETEDVNDADLDAYALAGNRSLASGNIPPANSYKYVDIPNDPEQITGGYLLEFEKAYRYKDEVSGFVTKNHQAIVVKEPEYVTKAQIEYIKDYYQDFEDALYARSGYNSKGKYYTDYIDIESLAKAYIIQEFAENFDGNSSSFFLSKDVDGKFIYGPVWDFDLSFGLGWANTLISFSVNSADPNKMYIYNTYMGNHNQKRNSLLGQALNHTDFQALVTKIWTEQVLPYRETFMNNINTFGENTAASAGMNAVRWNLYGTTGEAAIRSNYNGEYASISQFSQIRFDVLNKAFAPETHFVRYETRGTTKTVVLDDTMYTTGDTVTLKDAVGIDNNQNKFLGWTLSPYGFGEVLQAGDTISIDEDTVLYAVFEKDQTANAIIKAFFTRLKAFLYSLTKMLRSFENLPPVA